MVESLDIVAIRAVGGTMRIWGFQPLSILFVLLATAPINGAAADDSRAARYLVFSTQPDGSVRAVFSARVRLRTPLKGRPPTGARAENRESDEVRVTLEDGRRAVVFADTVEIPRWVRGEFHGQGPGLSGEYTIDAQVVPEPAATFVVRVPDVAGATLVLDSTRMPDEARVDLDALNDQSGGAQALGAPPPPLPGWSNGDPANRLDILILGDGYTAAQQGQFESDAQALADEFFSVSPYDDYRNYANVSALFTASAESGIDQPPYVPGCNEFGRIQSCCGDVFAAGETPLTVATAFNGTFCSFNTQRFATVSAPLVFAAAAAVPDWDEILVIVNSPTYGGSGGSYSVVSLSPGTTQVAQHEFGHTFMRLADEYTAPSPGYPMCSDVVVGAAACEANVTDETSRSLIKWARWIDDAQPIPSTDPPPAATDAGLWQGARYLTTGMYRQGYVCAMNFLGAPFCDVAAETYPLKLYSGGWGIPVGGIDNIEPGSESPAPGSLNTPYPGGSYSATILGPDAGPNVTAEWYLDSVLADTQSVATGGIASHTLVTTPGSHTLELRVTDNSSIIHPTMRAGVASSRTWNVTVAPAPVRISGKKLAVKDKLDQTKRKIVLVSNDTQIDTSTSGGVDPVANGATLQIYNANGSGESLCLTLPSASWQASGPPSSPSYTYKDTSFANGPCKVATVRHGKRLKIACLAKVEPIAYSLDEPTQGSIAVRFTSGSITYCASFGGTVSKDSGSDPPVVGGKGAFVAKDALAPVVCPAAPIACP